MSRCRRRILLGLNALLTPTVGGRGAIPLLGLLMLSACGGGGEGGNSTPQSYSISATVSGLSGSGLVLSQGTSRTSSVGADGQITLSASVANGSAYSIEVDTQPINPVQTCTVTGGSGTVNGANVNVNVLCVAGTATTVNAAKATVTIDSSVPSSAISAITAILSPLDSQPKGAPLFVPISTNAGETMVLAGDANNDIMLASLSTTTVVVLSADSTALALTRFVMGTLPTTASASQVNAAIHATAEYPNLVSAVSVALAAATSPATSPTVFANIGIVLSQLPDSVLATLAHTKRRVVHAQGTPVAQPSLTTSPSPFPLFTTSAAGHVIGSVSILSATTDGGVNASNTTAIAWSLSSSATNGTMLCPTGTSPSKGNPDCSVLVPHTGLLKVALNGPQSTALIPGNGDAFNITLEQNTVSRAANVLQLGEDLVSVVLGIFTAGASNAVAGCVGGAVDVLLPPDEVATLALDPSGTAVLSYLKAVLSKPISLVKGISSCKGVFIPKLPTGSNPVDPSFQQLVSNLVSGFTNYVYGTFGAVTGGLITVGATAGGIPLELAQTMRQWDFVGVVGVCEGGTPFAIANCATSFTFNPAQITLVPGTSFTPVPTALDVKGSTTVTPSDVVYSSPDSGVITLNTTTGMVSALPLPVGILSATATVTLTDTSTGVHGNFSITVAATPTLTVTATPANVDLYGTSTISWTSMNATSCSASEGWTSSTATSGSISTGPLSATTTFTMTCADANGNVSAPNAATVTVGPLMLVVYRLQAPSVDGNPAHQPPAGVNILTPVNIIVTGSTTQSSCIPDNVHPGVQCSSSTTLIDDTPGGQKGVSAAHDGTTLGAGGLYDPHICRVGNKWIARPQYIWTVVENDGLPPYIVGCSGAGFVRTRSGTVDLDSSGNFVVTFLFDDANHYVCPNIPPQYTQTIASDNKTTSKYAINLVSGAGSYSEATTSHYRNDDTALVAGLPNSYTQTDTTDGGSGSWLAGTPITNVGLTVVKTVPSTDPVPPECTMP